MTIWNAGTAESFSQRDSRCPLISVGCLINHENVRCSSLSLLPHSHSPTFQHSHLYSSTLPQSPHSYIFHSFIHFFLSYYSFQPVLHDWCNKGCGMCYPVCGMMHIKEPLLLMGKSSPCGGSGFPFLLSEWSFTICLMHITVNKMC